MPLFKIRAAKRGDVDALASLARRSVIGLSRPFYSDEQIRSASDSITVPDLDLIDDGTLFVAVVEGQIIGCGAWSRRKKLYTGSGPTTHDGGYLDPGCDRARIRAFFVDPDMSGKGVATAIHEVCAAEALRAGFTRFELMATLPGVPFYERLGYVVECSMELPLADGTSLPGCRMTFDLGRRR